MSAPVGDAAPVTAQAEYMRSYRKTPKGKETLRHQRLRRKAMEMANAALVRAHPTEHAVLLEAALHQVGVNREVQS